MESEESSVRGMRVVCSMWTVCDARCVKCGVVWCSVYDVVMYAVETTIMKCMVGGVEGGELSRL